MAFLAFWLRFVRRTTVLCELTVTQKRDCVRYGEGRHEFPRGERMIDGRTTYSSIYTKDVTGSAAGRQPS